MATDNLVTVLSEFKYLYDNLGLLVRAVVIGTLSLNNAELSSSDTLTTFLSKVYSFISGYRTRYYIQVSGLSFFNASGVTYLNSYSHGQRFDIRPVNGDTNGVANPNGASTLNINGIGAALILSNGLPLTSGELLLGQIYTVIYSLSLNAFQLETPTNRLSVNNNTSLAGDEGGVPLLTASGKFIRTTFLKFLTATGELTIGDANNPGKLTVFSNVFKLQVQDNIGDGQASIVINARQDKAFQIVDKLGNVYMLFRTLASGAGVVVSKLWIFDQNVSSPLYRAQAAVTSNGAGTKVYATKGDAANTQYSIDMATDTLVCALNFRLKVYDASGSKIIHAKWEGTFKRIGGVISIAGTPESKTLCDNGINSGFAFGVEPKADNSGLLLYFTPGSGDSTAYTGSFYDINYSI